MPINNSKKHRNMKSSRPLSRWAATHAVHNTPSSTAEPALTRGTRICTKPAALGQLQQSRGRLGYSSELPFHPICSEVVGEKGDPQRSPGAKGNLREREAPVAAAKTGKQNQKQSSLENHFY